MSVRKVAYLITLPEIGGAQMHVLQLLEALDRSRFEPILLTAGEGWLTERARERGVRVYPLRHLRRPIHPVHDWRALWEIRGILAREKPDVLHLHSSKAGILGRLAGKLARVPRILFTAHGFSFHERLAPLPLQGSVWLERVLAPLSDVIVPVSEYDRERALRFNLCEPMRLQVVLNGIETERFRGDRRHATRAALGLEPEDLVIGMVARFAFPKHPEFLLLALQPLLESRPNIRLIFVGSGPDFPRIQLLALELGIAEQVTFLGNREDVPDILAAMDIFTLISRFEGLPMTIIEAMAAGLPVIASDVGGVSELIDEGLTGFCVPSGDEEAIRRAFTRLLDDPERARRMGEAGRARARTEFDTSVMIRRVEALYTP